MNLYITPDQRWQAVASRDSTATGHFVYAVRTTGVYCHPAGCRSRGLSCLQTLYQQGQRRPP